MTYITEHLLVPIATFSVAAFLFFGIATGFMSHDRAARMQPHLTNLWRTAVAFLLAAIYAEISQ